MNYVWIALGFVALSFGANFLIDGACALARRFRVSDLAIGLTVVAFGTSAPELVVNIVAALGGTTEIAFTNILGSNAINVLVILGISALICPVPARKSSIGFDIPLSLLAGLIVLFLGADFFFDFGFKGLSRVDGIIFLIIFFLFLWHCFKTESAREICPGEVLVKPLSLPKAILLFLAGLLILIVGGRMIVRAAVAIALSWGVNQSIVGLTIVALGTSLPELATSVIAAIRKHTDLALGNVVGSNIFNVFFILGVSALLNPLPVYPTLVTDAIMASVGSFLVLLFVYFGRKHRITRWQGGVLLAVYIVFLFYLIHSL